MAGITSDVYDIFHPTPVSLKELSAIAVSLEVWRCKINELRNDGKLKEFTPFNEHTATLMKTLLPDLPPTIYAAIDKYIRRFRSIFENWLKEHHARIFHFYYDHQNSVLEHFEDFVCDYNGVIHYVKTAERMMHCDRFDVNQKFVIACTYFFEDDINRIWPSVSSNMDLNNIDFYKNPQLYYRMCCLRNELNKIPSTRMDDSVDKMMLHEFMPHNRPSIEFFWNRLPMENRMRKAVDIFTRDVVSFVRFILPKLDDQQLNEFVSDRTFSLMRSVSKKAQYDEELILSTWLYVKKVIDVNSFVDLVWKMLRSELLDYDGEDEYGYSNPKNWPHLCCEIWNSAAENWKRTAVTDVTAVNNNNRLSEELRESGFKTPTDRKKFIFLSSFLSYANKEERRSFWSNIWNNLFTHVRCIDLPILMKLCFENEDEMTLFKENVMINSDSVHSNCMLFMVTTCFYELNDCASFLCSDVRAARNFKQQFLQENLLDRDFHLFNPWRGEAKAFNQFIDDAYGDADLSANFKNQLMLLPSSLGSLSSYAVSIHSEEVVEYIETFGLAEDTLQQIKTSIIEAFEGKAAADKSVLSESRFSSVLSWCLGSDEEVEKFKTNCSHLVSTVEPLPALPFNLAAQLRDVMNI